MASFNARFLKVRKTTAIAHVSLRQAQARHRAPARAQFASHLGCAIRSRCSCSCSSCSCRNSCSWHDQALAAPRAVGRPPLVPLTGDREDLLQVAGHLAVPQALEASSTAAAVQRNRLEVAQEVCGSSRSADPSGSLAETQAVAVQEGHGRNMGPSSRGLEARSLEAWAGSLVEGSQEGLLADPPALAAPAAPAVARQAAAREVGRPAQRLVRAPQPWRWRLALWAVPTAAYRHSPACREAPRNLLAALEAARERMAVATMV